MLNLVDKYSWFFLLLCIYLSISHMIVGIDHDLFDLHGFRQSQTALSIHSLKDGGEWLAYHTPVMGPPWSIPLEFPLFQWFVAICSELSGLSIEFSARVINIALFFITVFLAGETAKALEFSGVMTRFTQGLVLLSPIYLFWTRTVMIETTALFLGVMYLFILAKNFWVQDEKFSYYAALSSYLIACLGAIVKVTTFWPFACLGSLIILKNLVYEWRTKSLLELLRSRFLLFAIMLHTFLLVSVLLWTFFADYHKMQNPLAAGFIDSKSLEKWTFGEWEQRYSLKFWSRINGFAYENVLSSPKFLLVVPILFLFLNSQRRWIVGSLFAAHFIGYFTFSNLFYVHDYYSYAIGFFLIFGFGLSFDVRMGRFGSILAAVFFTIVAFQSFDRYKNGYFHFQSSNANQSFSSKFGEIIKAETKPQDILLGYGLDWSSELPYASERRSILDRDSAPLESVKMKKALWNLENQDPPLRIGAVAFCNSLSKNLEFIKIRVDRFCLKEVNLPDDLRRCRFFVSNC